MNFDSLHHLQKAFAYVEEFIRAAVLRAQSQDENPTDALRGLIISDAEVQQHLRKGAFAAFWQSDPTPTRFLASLQIAPETRLAQLVEFFGLTTLDTAIFLLCLAPELDRRYERLYAYLQDDVSLRRPSVNLLMNLLGVDSATRFAVWERLQAEMPLRRLALVNASGETNQPKGAFLTQPLSVDTRIAAHLLGIDQPDERLKGAVQPIVPAETLQDDHLLSALADALTTSPLLYLQGLHGVGRREAAAALCARFNLPLIGVELARLAALDIAQTWRLAVREARLQRAALLLYDWESALNEERQPPADLWDALLDYPYPVFLCGKNHWEPRENQRARRMLRVDFKLPSYPERQQLWQRALAQHNVSALNPDELARKFRFTPAQIARAVNSAADFAASRASTITLRDLYSGAQAHSQLRLGQLAQQIPLRHDWNDLILPEDRLEQLRELCERAENTHLVREVWGFGRKTARSGGISALFAGESGTGKTMAAEVIAQHLGLVLYKIDLSAVVSKYIGETEKNLSVIFEEAQAANAILFFDEADALFGKRSEVKDARDRYANIETAYLLQRIEDYDGIAILATNLRQNMDEAFTRRLDVVIDFPFPDAEYRRRIWAVHFPPEVPLGKDVDLDTLAERYALAGGNIRNAALTSAYIAAADGRIITMRHIQHAIKREHQKMGRLIGGDF
ncbi:MAG: ATP-binding protein [Chloroflexi bacterium]|nr:ATP-binding protein [Chloroflexota bacterium]